MTDIKYCLAASADLQAIHALLTDCGLPAQGIELLAGNCIVGKTGTTLVGTISLEPFRSVALMRSLAVAIDYRGCSLGRRLVGRIIDHARSMGVEQLYLLTTDAEQYFAALGFRRVERNEVPSSIQSTSQFVSICPQSAVAMTRNLGGESSPGSD